MEFDIEKKESYTFIRVLSEKLDARVSPNLKSEVIVLSGTGEKNMLLELSSCKYCDSSGLSAILVANRLCKNAGGKLILTGLNEPVERLITISQLDSVLTILPSVELAESKF
jgi:anti-anti-sigma factor